MKKLFITTLLVIAGFVAQAQIPTDIYIYLEIHKDEGITQQYAELEYEKLNLKYGIEPDTKITMQQLIDIRTEVGVIRDKYSDECSKLIDQGRHDSADIMFGRISGCFAFVKNLAKNQTIGYSEPLN